MGKIGDLFVRLALKSDDYKKGMADAKKETGSFSQGLGKMKAGALAVWGAIGTAVVSFARDFINSSNKIGDKWAQVLGGMKQSWTTFKAMLTNWDFKDFGARIADAFKGGMEGVAGADEVFEITNKIAIARAKLQNTLNDLFVGMADPNKTYEERIAAGKEYLRLQKSLYDEEIALMQRQRSNTIKMWLSGSNIKASEEDVVKFFSGYTGSAEDAVSKMFPQIRDWYETLNDEANIKVVEAIKNLLTSQSAYKEVTTRVRKQLNTLGYQYLEGFADFDEELQVLEQSIYDEVDAINDIEKIEVPEIDTSALDKADAELKAFTESWKKEQQEIQALNDMLTDSIVGAIGGGMEAFSDMLAGIEGADAKGVLAALMQPFADTAGQLGGMLLAQGIAVEAFKTSLSSLQGAPAIAAGLSLIAISAAMKSGIKALAKGGASAGSAASYGGSTTAGGSVENYESTLTINVVGTIKGSDIALSLDRTNKNSKR